MLIYRFDEARKYFVEDVWYTGDEGTLPEFHTHKAVPATLVKPTYIEGTWVEGATSIEVNTRALQLTEQQAERIRTEQKGVGKLYEGTGVIVPFRSTDALAVLQVKAAFEVGVTSTNIKFSNGDILPITSVDFPVFAAWFSNERNKFFL